MPRARSGRLRRFKAILFDLSGTLVEDRDFGQYAEIAEQLGVSSDLEAMGEAVRWATAEFDRTQGWPSPVEFWRAVLGRAAQREIPPLTAQRFVAQLDRSPRVAHLFSDVRRTLERLRSEGRTLAVVSNFHSESSVREMLESVGILSYFSTLVSRGAEGPVPSDPEILRRAARSVGVAPEEAFYVGDLAYTDAKAGAAAGLGSVWLNRDGTGFGTDPPEITSLSELPRWVARIEGAFVK